MIEFSTERIEEGDDHSWEQLIVKTPDKDWHSAQLTYGTEDLSKIREIVEKQSVKEI